MQGFLQKALIVPLLLMGCLQRNSADSDILFQPEITTKKLFASCLPNSPSKGAPKRVTMFWKTAVSKSIAQQERKEDLILIRLGGSPKSQILQLQIEDRHKTAIKESRKDLINLTLKNLKKPKMNDGVELVQLTFENKKISEVSIRIGQTLHQFRDNCAIFNWPNY